MSRGDRWKSEDQITDLLPRLDTSSEQFCTPPALPSFTIADLSPSLRSYAERCPERFAPGRFDLFGTSHQIFHVMILFAAYAHWCAIAEGFRYWHEERLGVCPA